MRGDDGTTMWVPTGVSPILFSTDRSVTKMGHGTTACVQGHEGIPVIHAMSRQRSLGWKGCAEDGVDL